MSDPVRHEPPERPLLRPWVSLDPDPVLFYADAAGRVVALRLDAVDLASLALSIAEAQAATLQRDLKTSVQARQCKCLKNDKVQPCGEAKRG